MTTLITTFGRMNPPTISHIKMIKVMLDIATINGGIPVVYLSETWDEKKNPLTFSSKYKLIQSVFDNLSTEILLEKAKDVLDVLKLNDGKYDKVIFVCGSDRVDEYKKLLNKYNGNLYEYDSIHVHGLKRNDGVSATLARKLACMENYTEFSKIIAGGDVDKTIYKNIRSVCCPYDVMMEHGQDYLNDLNTPGCEKWILKKHY